MSSGDGSWGEYEPTDSGIENSGPSTAQLARAAFGAGYYPPETPLTPITPPPPPPDPAVVRQRMVRASLGWSMAAVLLLITAFAGVAALNREIFSASGFVQQYLSALENGSAVDALSMPGVRPSGAADTNTDSDVVTVEPSTTSEALLRNSVLRGPTRVEIESDIRGQDGVHTVRASFLLDGVASSSTFRVSNTGSIAGIFPTWRFATSPLAVFTVAVAHAAVFDVNDLQLDARASADLGSKPGFSNSGNYLALVPASYTFVHQSEYLDAKPVVVRATASGPQEVAIDAQPNDAFVEAVQGELNGYLDQCTTQQVLKPSDCPFGVDIDDRVVSDPVWSIVAYPVVTLSPDEMSFAMPETDGIAHLEVEVQSLFDGEINDRSSDEPFQVKLTVTISEQGALQIKLR